MINVSISTAESGTKKIRLGRQGENEVRQVVFDLNSMVERYGDGLATLVFQRNGDMVPYVINTSRSENSLTWLVDSTDTAKAGPGRAEIRWYVSGALAKTVIFTTETVESMSADTEVPDDFRSWYDKMVDYVDAQPQIVIGDVQRMVEGKANAAEVDNIYAKKTDIPTKLSKFTNDAGYLKAVPSEYVTDSELEARKYLTQHQDISGKADRTDVDLLASRFDNVVGAVSSDTELTDIRVTFDGNIEETAGTAVRKQVQGLRDNIDELQENISGVYEQNYTGGKNLSTTEIIDDPDTCLSDEVPVTWGTSRVAFNYTGDTADAHTYRIWFLDENKNLIQVYGRNPVGSNLRSVVTPDNAAFVLFSFKKGFAGKLYSSNTDVYYTAQDQLTSPGLEQKVGNLSELETSNKDSLVKSINEVKRSNVSLPIKPKDTNFFYVSPNIADPAEFVDDEFVNQTTGNFVSNTNHKRSGYIPVEAGATYCVVNENAGNSEVRYAFYTLEKTYISGAIVRLATIDYIVTAPDNAAYMAFSSTKSAWPLMVAKSDALIPYVEFGIAYLQPEYLPSTEPLSDVIVNLPSKIYAYVGYELNIYFENIVEDWTKYKWDVSCSKGRQMERGFNITPVGDDVGTYTLTIKLYTSDDNAKTVSTSLVISPLSAGADATKSLIILGDSTTANGIAVGKLVDNFASDGMNIDLRGTRGEAPAKHEGRSGWSWDTYFTTDTITYTDGRGTVDNPFFNPTSQTFDASYYFANSGVSAPDWFFLNMGINDMFSFANDGALESGIVTALGLLESAITSIKTAAPDTKIGLCLTIPPNHSQDAFGKAYKCNQTRDRYKRNNLIWVNRLISEYDNHEAENIYLVPIYTNLDTVYNMGMEALPVNARNTETTYQSPISNGGVHPVTSGYWQIADVYTAFLKAHA